MRSSKPAKGELSAVLVSVLLVLSPTAAGAQVELEQQVAADDAIQLARTARGRSGYQHWFGGAYLGRGLRFNNPYRLRSVLGEDAESLSLGATYVDLHVARTFSDPDELEHGIGGQLSIATDGVRQEVFTPAYVVAKRFDARFLGYGRAGVPIVLEPDASLGLSGGLGGAYFLSAGLGLGIELDFSVFYGAATVEKPLTVIPVLSLAVGLFVDWERLP